MSDLMASQSMLHLYPPENRQQSARFPPQPTKEGAIRGLLATDLIILIHGQVTRTTHELAPASPNLHTPSTGGRLSSRQILRASLPCMVGIQLYWARTHDTPAMSPLPGSLGYRGHPRSAIGLR
ncbi:hypothetical protein TNCV_4521291 [Trichonephila clavipes]|nr:hypothetical protein TNCV_4521291 [Trichonephila clavipes]